MLLLYPTSALDGDDVSTTNNEIQDQKLERNMQCRGNWDETKKMFHSLIGAMIMNKKKKHDDDKKNDIDETVASIDESSLSSCNTSDTHHSTIIATKKGHRPDGNRMVQFDLSLNTVHVDDSAELSQQEKNDAFWSINNQNICIQQACVTVKHFKHYHSDCIEDFLYAIAICNHCSVTAADAANLDQNNHLAVLRNLKSISSMRGLEDNLTPALRYYRLVHGQQVLERYSKIPKELKNPNLKERMLAVRSMQLSRPSKILALVMGALDEIEAQKL